MKKKTCAICLETVERDDIPILTMGAYGTPKYLCEDCAALMETATSSREVDDIVSAMDKLTKKLSDKNIDDRFTVETVTAMFEDAARRASAIKEGTYDFALDEVEDGESFDEIPEELAETEEDRALDEKERAEAKRLDGFMNWVWLGALVGALGFIIWRIFF